MKRTRILILSAIVLLAGVFLFLSWQNSSALQAVSIRIKDGVKEHTDHTILGLGAEHRLPDYKVQLRISRKLMSIDLGTKLNVSATNWLEYPVNDLIPVRQLQEIIIVEDDKVENDLLERIQLTGETMEGEIGRASCRERV